MSNAILLAQFVFVNSCCRTNGWIFLFGLILYSIYMKMPEQPHQTPIVSSPPHDALPAAPLLHDMIAMEIRASIEVVDEATETVIPELRTTAAKCSPDHVEKLAEQMAALNRTTCDLSILHREQLLRADDLRETKAQWKLDIESAKNNNESLLMNLFARRENIISCYRKILHCLNMSMRMQKSVDEQSTWTLEFKCNERTNVLIFEYNDVTDAFELLKMTPKLTNFNEIQTILRNTQTEDMESLIRMILCCWRAYCQKLEAVQQTQQIVQ